MRAMFGRRQKPLLQTHKKRQALPAEEASFAAQPDISIDYTVMEKAKKIAMVLAGFGWSDVSSWDAVADAHEADANGNGSISGKKVHFVEAKNTHVKAPVIRKR